MSIILLLFYLSGIVLAYTMLYQDTRESIDLKIFEHAVMLCIAVFSWLTVIGLFLGKSINRNAGKSNEDFNI